jgi:mono/diheme cytochrome c family protein/glucose/arabinose dehydrogenase
MRPLAFAVRCTVLFAALCARGAAEEGSAARGAALFQLNCAACHQPTGQGVPHVFPPLAGSDFLLADKDRSIRIAIQGLSGPIVVNGIEYQGVMPTPARLEDREVADILTYVRSAWGNRGDAVTAAEVQKVRAELLTAHTDQSDPYGPLPAPPAGFTLREVVRLPVNCVRFATVPGADWILLLNNEGELYRLEPATGNFVRLLVPKDYAELAAGRIDALGLTVDSERRLYVVTNQRVAEQPHHINRVVIFRSEPLDASGRPPALKAWLRTSYPWGNNYYNHGVCHIAQGPDGLIYVSSGARTDGGEVDGGIFKSESVYWKGGETDFTAAIWRLDPAKDSPAIEVYARGIRNAWSFAWNDRGELFSVSNGPDAEMPEELDFVERGKHYGFPYQFADQPATAKPYPYTPAAPPGLTFTPSLRNFGPAGGGSATAPLASFDPHSSPAGLVYCGPDWPAALRGKFLMGRFGSLIGKGDVGFDLLTVSLQRDPTGTYVARTETFLSPLARPIDLLRVGRKLYILEYTRHTSMKSGRPLSPGRVLELSW